MIDNPTTHDASPAASTSRVFRVGAVRFLNAKPLIFGLDRDPRVRLALDVPSALGEGLDRGRLDVAMVPAIDYHRARLTRRWVLVPGWASCSGGPSCPTGSAGCIASDDETLTVRVFSRVPVERIDRLLVDADSHTSLVLARIILRRGFNRSPRIEPADMRAMLAAPPGDRPESVLLIGDKVVAAGPNDPASPWPVQLDLGRAWRQLTGLPFVFAVWAARADTDLGELPRILAEAKAAGLKRCEQIARDAGPPLGWPVDLATAYLTHHLAFDLTPPRQAGLERFFDLAKEEGLV